MLRNIKEKIKNDTFVSKKCRKVAGGKIMEVYFIVGQYKVSQGFLLYHLGADGHRCITYA